MSDIVGKIIDYESGELDGQGTLELFSELIKTRTISSLQGHYQRTANYLINDGHLDLNGDIL